MEWIGKNLQIRHYQDFSKQSGWNDFFTLLKRLFLVFFKDSGSFLSKSRCSIDVGRRIRTKIAVSTILGTIKLSIHVSRSQTQVICLATQEEITLMMPRPKAIFTDHIHWVRMKMSKKPVTIVSTVFSVSNFGTFLVISK